MFVGDDCQGPSGTASDVLYTDKRQACKTPPAVIDKFPGGIGPMGVQHAVKHRPQHGQVTNQTQKLHVKQMTL